MKNIRRFQRTIIVGFLTLNAFAYAQVNQFSASEKLVVVVATLVLSTSLVLLFSKRKTSKSKISINA